VSSEDNKNLIRRWPMAEYGLQELETLKADIAKLRSDLTDLAQKLVDIGTDQVGTVKETLTGQAQSVMDTMRQVFGDTREQGRRTIENIQQQVGEKPYVILIAALAAGFLLTRLLERRSESETTSEPETSGGTEVPSQFRTPMSETASAKVRSKAQDLKEKLSQTFGNTRERSKKTFETVQGQIGDRPLISLLVASGVGLLLGKLIERRSNSRSSD
jgi:ElaB/YqjD/DUF883 family membrane-anchored ribosome-binding protein